MAKKKFGSLFLLLGGITIAGGVAVLATRKAKLPKPDPGNPTIQCIKAPCELPGQQGKRDGQS